METLGEVLCVAGDDVVRAGGHSTFQEAVVGLVFGYSKADSRLDEAAGVADYGQRTGDCGRTDAEMGRRSTTSYSAMTAGETYIGMILLAARSKIAEGRPSSLKFADTTTLVSTTTFI
jgi:hypothetical protein